MMKKSVSLVLAIVVLSSLVFAGESYDLNSFDVESVQGIVVGEGDEVRFDLFNATHTLIFNRVKDVGFRFTGYGYMDSDFRITGFATKDWSSHIDIDHDNVSDMIVAFYDSEYDEESNKTYATVIFKLEDNKMTAQATGVPDDAGIVKERDYSRYLSTIGAVAFILILVLIARKSGKRRKETIVEEDKDESSDSEEENKE